MWSGLEGTGVTLDGVGCHIRIWPRASGPLTEATGRKKADTACSKAHAELTLMPGRVSGTHKGSEQKMGMAEDDRRARANAGGASAHCQPSGHGPSNSFLNKLSVETEH